MTIQPGTRLGRYEIRSLIGEGGMGQVYQAIDTALAREVAIKVLPPDLARAPDRLKRLFTTSELTAIHLTLFQSC